MIDFSPPASLPSVGGPIMDGERQLMWRSLLAPKNETISGIPERESGRRDQAFDFHR
ncbi:MULTISPECIES: hypothetical protein [unclassified Mesorhizobium]|uniref:hypothetical protein n=1 Tax=unclassified Mesorhizobium TaxID=325217 RepID=UPI0019255B67|nr:MULTISPECIES: hypothetical protein [unclassified Mesorhizobium]